MPGLVGTMQALEAIKLITGIGDPLIGRLLHIEARGMKFREFSLRSDPACARCVEERRNAPVVEEGPVCEVPQKIMQEITVQELAAARSAGEKHVLLDVREPWELAVARLEPCMHIPLGEVPARHAEIPRDVPLYVMCHGGVRSAAAAKFLSGQGFSAVANIRGGIGAWSAEIDAAVPAY
jgi:adenylyltransferase/sulfurtransferase